MRVPRPDLRIRIAFVLAAACIAVVGGLGFTLLTASAELERSLITQVVSEEMESLVQRARVTGAVPPGGPNLQYYVLTTTADHEKVPAHVRDLPPGHHNVGRGVDAQHVAVRDLDGKRYVVAYDSGQHEALEIRFRQLLFLAVGTVALIAIVLGYWLAGVLTRQLRELATRVRSLAPDEPHAPLERKEHDRELGALAHALDQYHARIVDMMRREQEFTANTSHELRTPLTAIRTSCELLTTDPGLTQKARTRIDMIDSAARQMTERIEALLFLARQHRPEAPELVALRRCVEEAAGPHCDEIARKGLVFEVAVPDEEVVRIDRKALQLVLANLIKNAVTHTEHGTIRVSYDSTRLVVTDSGSGIAGHHLPQVFDRHYRADDKPGGSGLGLAIVRRICDDLGWTIEVQSEPGAGSAFSVRIA
jgi:signal transduction histidine kinase